MPGGLEAYELLAWRGDAVRARHIREGDHAVGVADIERVAEQRHAERLVQSLHENFALFGDAVAIRVAQQRDAVRADAEGCGTSHRRLHRVAEHASGRSGDLVRLGDEDVAIGQHVIQRGCFRPVANALTLSPGAATGFCPSVHPLAVGILSVGICPRLRHRNHWSAAPGRLGCCALQPPPQQRGGADHATIRAKIPDKAHFIPLLIARTLSEARVCWNLLFDVRVRGHSHSVGKATKACDASGA